MPGRPIAHTIVRTRTRVHIRARIRAHEYIYCLTPAEVSYTMLVWLYFQNPFAIPPETAGIEFTRNHGPAHMSYHKDAEVRQQRLSQKQSRERITARNPTHNICSCHRWRNKPKQTFLACAKDKRKHTLKSGAPKIERSYCSMALLSGSAAHAPLKNLEDATWTVAFWTKKVRSQTSL